MRKSVSVLLVAAVCILALGLTSSLGAQEQEMKVAKRWALGLSSNALNFGLAPTVEYWTSENFGLSASFSYYFWSSLVGLRGTYLWNKPIHIFSMPARPYAGAGVGLFTINPYLNYKAYYGPNIEAFGGLFQPFSEQLSVRAELGASFYYINLPSGYTYSRGYVPLSIGVGIFYHLGGNKS